MTRSIPSRARLGAALATATALVLSLLSAPGALAGPVRGETLDPVIIGGTDADIADAPWQVALVLSDPGYPSDWYGQFCGGSIVSSWEIVTAAHCVDYGGDLRLPGDVLVLAGTATLSTSQKTGVAVESITVHPDWNDATFENDVAVLRLTEPIVLTPGVREAIALASTPVADGSSALITGWGNTSTSGIDYPTRLKKATVETVSDAACNSAYGGIASAIMLCATAGGFTIDTCQGDSGGPLVVTVDDVPTLAGITSWGNGCAEAPYPGVYAEVSAFQPWISAQLTAKPQVTRIAGVDRYTTAIEISRTAFPDPVVSTPVVVVASGTDFPDALSAGPVAAALGGPLLLTNPLTLPAEVTAEITRLNPDMIYVVGGTGAVSAAVYTALAGLAPAIERVWGADRYATSRAVTDLGFDSADAVYVATGTNFPDALSAGAAAGTVPAPVLLVRGTATAADAATVKLITDLGATRIEVVGGTGVISAAMFDSLDDLAPATRRAGADRITTAIEVNRAAFDTSEFVYLANAFSFPDALAGGVLATLDPGPLFPVTATCLPQAVRTAITDLGANEVRLLGGTGVLTMEVAALRTC